MRPLLAIVFVLTCVMTFPRPSVGQDLLPFEHEVLRGYVEPHVGGVGGQAPGITLRLTIAPESDGNHKVIDGNLRCRTRATPPIPACIGRQAVLGNVSLGSIENSPREAASQTFDADVTFVQQGVSCHFTGVTPFFGILLEVISGSYTCANPTGSVVETGTFGIIRQHT